MTTGKTFHTAISYVSQLSDLTCSKWRDNSKPSAYHPPLQGGYCRRRSRHFLSVFLKEPFIIRLCDSIKLVTDTARDLWVMKELQGDSLSTQTVPDSLVLLAEK